MVQTVFAGAAGAGALRAGAAPAAGTSATYKTKRNGRDQRMPVIVTRAPARSGSRRRRRREQLRRQRRVHRRRDEARNAAGQQRTGHQAQHHRVAGDHLHHDDEGRDRPLRRRRQEARHAQRDERDRRLAAEAGEQRDVVADAGADGERGREHARRHAAPGRQPGGAQLQRISVVRDNVAFKELLKQHEAGELPRGGSVIFFTNEGTLLYQSELKVSQHSTQARAKDHASAEKHANNTPAFIDVAKIDRGLGPEGAGLWRFIGQENRIVGAAILQPVIKDGKLVELPGAKNRNGEPTIKKEVFRTIGDVPAEVTVNMAYGHLLNMLRSRKITAERSAAPDTVPSSDTLIGQTGHTGSTAALSKPEGK